MSHRRPCLTAAVACAITVCCRTVTSGIAEEEAPTGVERQTKLVLPTVQPEAVPELVTLPTPTHSEGILSVKLSLDGRTLVTRAGGELFVWDLAGRFVRWRFPYAVEGPDDGMGISADGRLVAVNDGHQLSVWDTRASRLVSVLETVLERVPGRIDDSYESYYGAPVFSPDGALLAVCGVELPATGVSGTTDRRARYGPSLEDLVSSIGIFDPASGRRVDRYTADQGTFGDLRVAFRSDGALIAYNAHGSENRAKPSRMVNSSGQREIELRGAESDILSADGEWRVDSYREGPSFHVRLRSTRDGSVRRDVVTELCVPLACDGTHVVVQEADEFATRSLHRLALLDLGKGTMSVLPGAYEIRPGALPGDGAYLVMDGGLVDIETGRRLLELGSTSASPALLFGSGERSLVSFFDGRPSVGRWTGAEDPAFAVPSGARLAYADSSVWAWATPAGLEVLPRGKASTAKPGSWPDYALDPAQCPSWGVGRLTRLGSPWWNAKTDFWPGAWWAKFMRFEPRALGLQDDGTVLWAEPVGELDGLGLSARTPDGRVDGMTSMGLIQAGLRIPGADELWGRQWLFPSFGRGGRKLAFLLIDDPVSATEPSHVMAAMLDIASGTILNVLAMPAAVGQITWVRLLADDNTVAMLYATDSTADQRLVFCDMGAGQVAHSWDLGREEDTRVLAMTADGSRVVTGDAAGVHVYAVPAGGAIGHIPSRPGQTVVGADVTVSGDRLVLTYDDRQSTLWDLSLLDGRGEPRLLATLYDFPDGEWATATPSGHVDCSPGGSKYLAWQLGDSVYPFEQFAAKYRRPDLVRRALAGEDISAERGLTGADVPPTAAFLAPEYDATIEGETAKVEVEVVGVRPLGRVDLLIDGRPIPDELAATAKWEQIEPNHGVYTFELPLSRYQRRTRLQATVHDEEGLQSMPAEVTFTRAGAPPPATVLHALSVGVSAYRNEEWNNLKFADKDAESFAKVAGEGAARKVLLNENATASSVRFALEEMKASVTEDDIVAIFLAGHGTVDATGNYYMLLHDSDVADLENTALRWDDFVAALKSIRAKLVMVFADTCHSGSITGQESVNTLIDRLNRRAGVVVFTASRGDEASIEREDWGHGAFTKALLEGFSGEADTYPKDKQVSLAELREYVIQRVEELTSGRQHPYLPRLEEFDPARPIANVLPGLT